MGNEMAVSDLNHFLSSARQEVISAREALLNADSDKFGDIVSRVASLNVVKLIIDKANTSMSYLDEMFERIERAGPSVKIFAGLSIVAAGAALWTAGSALSTIIAFALILYGIIIAVPAAVELVLIAADDIYEGIITNK